jgi:hypothetical protein
MAGRGLSGEVAIAISSWRGQSVFKALGWMAEALTSGRISNFVWRVLEPWVYLRYRWISCCCKKAEARLKQYLKGSVWQKTQNEGGEHTNATACIYAMLRIAPLIHPSCLIHPSHLIPPPPSLPLPRSTAQISRRINGPFTPHPMHQMPPPPSFLLGPFSLPRSGVCMPPAPSA